jgi:long-chain acyl-CoA synthetase
VTGGQSVFAAFFEPAAVMDLIEKYQVNWTVMVPTMIAMVFDHPQFRPERLASLGDLVYGASPMPAGLLERLLSSLPGTGIWQGYGMTECSSVLTFLTDDDHRAGGPRLRSAGRPTVGVTIAVLSEDGQPVNDGHDGEICARSGNFMREYWHRPEETEDAFRDGWYHTGDEGHVDADGYVYLVDRVKDMIVTGGENVYSIEVENALAGAPGVGEAAAVAVPDEMMGEKVGAVIVPAAGAQLDVEAVVGHCRARLADFKVPQYLALREEPLPRNPAGKVLKAQLREETEWGKPLR